MRALIPSSLLCVAAALLAVVWSAPARAQVSLVVERTMWISATGTAAENCTALRNVLDSIPGPGTLANAYLVKVGPGRYDCGLTTVNVPAFVAVEGAGIEVTLITGSQSSPTEGVVTFNTSSGFSELRSMTVAHLGGAIDDAIAVGVGASTEVVLENVVLVSPPGPTNSTALRAAATDAGAVFVVARHSVVSGPTAATAAEGATIQLVSTRVNGPVTETSGGSIMCANSFTNTLAPLNSNCSP